MRTTLLAAALICSTALAQNKELVVVDDVGVGDHFPSQVPGSAPYRLPERDVVVRPESAERPASDPAEWASPPVQPMPAALPVPAAQPAREAASVSEAVAAQAEPRAQAAIEAPSARAAPGAQVATAQPAPAPAQPSALAHELELTAIERASDSLLQGTCETELPRLAELLERSDRSDTRARARILRARCFTQRSKTVQANLEYQLYLRDFPTGRWVAEAREVIAEP
jgi:hypothetical protein